MSETSKSEGPSWTQRHRTFLLSKLGCPSVAWGRSQANLGSVGKFRRSFSARSKIEEVVITQMAPENYMPSRARPNMGEPRGVAPVFGVFCEETTAHAFFQIGDPERHWWARFMWLLILIGFVGVFGWQFLLLVDKYAQFGVNVNTDVGTLPNMTFPTISVCNTNPYKVTQVPDKTYLSNYLTLVTALLGDSGQCNMKTACEATNNTMTKIFCDMMGHLNPSCAPPDMNKRPPPPSGKGQAPGPPSGAGGAVNKAGGDVGSAANQLGENANNLAKGVANALGRKRRDLPSFPPPPNPQNQPNPQNPQNPQNSPNLPVNASAIINTLVPALVNAVDASIQSNLSSQQVQAILTTVAPYLLTTALQSNMPTPPSQPNAPPFLGQAVQNIAPDVSQIQNLAPAGAPGQILGNLSNLLSNASQIGGALNVVQSVVDAVTEAVGQLQQSDIPNLSLTTPALLSLAAEIVATAVANAQNVPQNANPSNQVNMGPGNQVGSNSNSQTGGQNSPPNMGGQGNVGPQQSPSQGKTQNTMSSNDQNNTSDDQNKTRPGGDGGQMSLLKLETMAVGIIGTLGQMEPELYDKATQMYKEFVQDCQFNKGDCKMDDHSAWPNPFYGKCFNFNPNGEFESVRPGGLYGLAMQLFVHTKEYLPNIFTIGVRVGVNEPGNMAFPEIDGVFAPVGMSTAIGISVVENNRLGAPYTNCLTNTTGYNNRSSVYYYGTNYTVLGCQNTCLQREIVKDCGCWNFAYPKPPSNTTHNFSNGIDECGDHNSEQICIPLCDFNNSIGCVNKLTMSKHIDCTCNPICTDRTYQLTVSQSNWPAHGLPNCPPEDHLECDNNTDAFAKTNMLKLMVYYESMTKFTYTESAAYPLLSLVSDFGGQLGLWIGASFCTIIEVLSLMISLVGGCCGFSRGIEKQRKRDNLVGNEMILQMKRPLPHPEYQAPPRIMY